MKQLYEAYTKEINAEVFYFVKRFTIVDGLDTIPPILAGFGMHANLEKACQLAGVSNSDEVKHILNGTASHPLACGKVVAFNDARFKPGKKSHDVFFAMRFSCCCFSSTSNGTPCP